MLFEKLAIENLGIFRGAHILDLTPPDRTRPVVLVGALNGSGKTTVIEALQLALYGKRAAYGWRNAPTYQDYLNQVRNRYAQPSEPTVAEVTLQFSSKNGIRRYRVHREWTFLKSQPREYLLVYRDGEEKPDSGLSESWDDEVDRLLPPQLSQLFFFDGERIEKLADPATSASVLSTAISSLLGLDLIDQLATDLDILRRRQKENFLTDSDRAKADRIDTDYRQARQEHEDVLQEKASFETITIPAATRQRDLARQKTNTLGGVLFGQRDELQATRSRISNCLSLAQAQLRLIAGGPLPLRLLTPTLGAMSANAAATNSPQSSAAVRDALRAHLNQLREWVSERAYSKAVKADIGSHLASTLLALETTDGELPSTLSEATASQLRTLLATGFDEVLACLMHNTAEADSASQELRKVEEQLARAPEEDQLAAAFREQGSAQSHLDHLERDAAALGEREKTLIRRIDQLAQERVAHLDSIRETGDAQRLADYCHRSAQTLARYRAGLVQRRREQLETLILEAFTLLSRKPDLITHIHIDPGSMALRLENRDGQNVETTQLSAGERQLLAVAMLWGLARASGRPVPVVIDTPLGRLDGKHRRHLVERYFPDASHQVILLSTDQEVDSRFSKLLAPSVGHRYLIDYDPQQQSSAFSAGYFATT